MERKLKWTSEKFPMLIQEVINAMATGETVMPIFNGLHIHPALPELIQAAFQNLQEPL